MNMGSWRLSSPGIGRKAFGEKVEKALGAGGE